MTEQIGLFFYVEGRMFVWSQDVAAAEPAGDLIKPAFEQERCWQEIEPCLPGDLRNAPPAAVPHGIVTFRRSTGCYALTLAPAVPRKVHRAICRAFHLQRARKQGRVLIETAG